MISIDTRFVPAPISRIGNTVEAAAGPATASLSTGVRPADDASSLPSASSLRVRIAGLHDESVRLGRTTAISDAADESLGRAQGLLEQAHQTIQSQGAPVDGILNAFDQETARPSVDGVAVLHEGFTLATARGDLDIRPMNTSSIGAVVDSGRSHRLSDLRTGGSLDPRLNPGAALRSTEGAMREVNAMRSQLIGFRASVLLPAQAETLAAARSAAGAGPVTAEGAGSIATLVRSGLTAGAGASALTSANPQKVLSLLA